MYLTSLSARVPVITSSVFIAVWCLCKVSVIPVCQCMCLCYIKVTPASCLPQPVCSQNKRPAVNRLWLSLNVLFDNPPMLQYVYSPWVNRDVKHFFRTPSAIYGSTKGLKWLPVLPDLRQTCCPLMRKHIICTTISASFLRKVLADRRNKSHI